MATHHKPVIGTVDNHGKVVDFDWIQRQAFFPATNLTFPDCCGDASAKKHGLEIPSRQLSPKFFLPLNPSNQPIHAANPKAFPQSDSLMTKKKKEFLSYSQKSSPTATSLQSIHAHPFPFMFFSGGLFRHGG